ncbi:MAG: heavy-metal-associated domain-containing protein [Pseudomonadota bacterium]
MYELQVDNMSCGHCVDAVTRAVQGLDPAAKVRIDLAAKTVSIDSHLPPARLSAAIVAAGYPVAGAQ